MAFGQQSGPPASHKQIQQLSELLTAAGHSDFRDARGPMGFSQRQAGGKFTRDEADAFIAQLEMEPSGQPGSAPLTPEDLEDQIALKDFPDQALAAELQRRGWIVMEA